MKWFKIVVACICMLTGCQSYDPKPLDDKAHEKEWSSRSLGDKRVKAYTDLLMSLNAELTSVPTSASASNTLDLKKAEIVALVFNPDLRVERLKAKVPLMGAHQSGLWDDPTLDLDLLRLAQGAQNPWILATSLSFTIPISGRLEFEKKKAFAQADVELRRAMHSEWLTLRELRIAWTQWSATVRRIGLLEAYIEKLDSVIDLAEIQRRASRIGRPDLRVLEMERATRIGRLESLRLKKKREALAIKSILGLKPDAPVEFQPLLEHSAPAAALDDRRILLRNNNLRLAVARAEYEVADHAFHLEVRKQYPDLVVGPGFENDDGASSLGVVLSLPIPLFNQNRRAVAETMAARDAAKVAYEAEHEKLIAELFQAELVASESNQRSRYLKDVISPMIRAQLEDLQSLAKLGDLDVLVILNGMTQSLEAEFQILEAKVSESVAKIKLLSLLRPIKTPLGEGVQDEKE